MSNKSNEQRAQNRKALAERCAWARKRLGLSAKEVTRRANVAENVVGNTERGRNETIRNIIEVARALQVNPHWLATGEGAYDDLLAHDATPVVPPFRNIPQDEIDMAIAWLSIWRDADPITRGLIEGVFTVAHRNMAPLLRSA